MTGEAILGLATAALVFALIPGPGMTALVAQSLSRGFSHGVRFGVGLVMGDMVYLLTALYGMGWVASQLGGYFVLLKWIGAAYLGWLGVKSLMAAFSGKMPDTSGETDTVRKTRFRGSTFLAGTCVTLGNHKVIAFYCGFLPGFVDMAGLTPLDMAEVVGTIVPVVLGVVVMYAWLAARGREAARSTRLWKWANGTAGCVMIGAGVAVVADQAAETGTIAALLRENSNPRVSGNTRRS